MYTTTILMYTTTKLMYTSGQRMHVMMYPSTTALHDHTHKCQQQSKAPQRIAHAHTTTHTHTHTQATTLHLCTCTRTKHQHHMDTPITSTCTPTHVQCVRRRTLERATRPTFHSAEVWITSHNPLAFGDQIAIPSQEETNMCSHYKHETQKEIISMERDNIHGGIGW